MKCFTFPQKKRERVVRHCLIHSQIENRPVTDNKLQFATFFLSHTHIPCASLFTRLQKSIQPFRKALSALNVRSCSHFSFVTLAHALGRKKCLCNRFRYNYLLPIISFTCVELEELRHSFELTLCTTLYAFYVVSAFKRNRRNFRTGYFHCNQLVVWHG